MAIGNAVQRGGWVHVYDEKGKKLTAIDAGNRKDDGLKGYTSTTVSVRRGNWIFTYDEKGRKLNSTAAR